MNVFLENTFSLNNYISVSDKIKQIPLYFIYFFPVDQFKNLDGKYKQLPHSSSNAIQREIKYKIVSFKNTCSNIAQVRFDSQTFPISLYHVFVSASILHEKQISFTIDSMVDYTLDTMDDVLLTPFIQHDNSRLPLLNNFSSSFYFPIIRLHNMKLYFSRKLLFNPYIPFELYLITYLLHNNIDTLTPHVILHVKTSFHNTLCKHFEPTESFILIQMDYIGHKMNSFANRDVSHIISHLLLSKYTWTYYSFCMFFRIHYSKQLMEYALHDLLESYIQSSYDERNPRLITDIYNILFTNIRM